ncbi:hypothetical protein [Streptomyces tubercidicus]|uniref:hypothetical protein n=1 Tax=Streptomyces tubercidicus TaxID=47759 RepID=UPI00368EF41B
MSLLHDHIVHALNLNANKKLDYLPEIPDELPDGKFDLGTKSRKQLRLIANAAITALALKSPERFRYDLQAIRSINDRKTANIASNRLMRIAECVEEDEEAAGDKYRQAARLAEVVLEHYDEMPMSESFVDIAGAYASVPWIPSPKVQPSVLELLKSLRELEGRTTVHPVKQEGLAKESDANPDEDPFVSVTFKQFVGTREEGEAWARKLQEAVGTHCGAWDEIEIDLPEA